MTTGDRGKGSSIIAAHRLHINTSIENLNFSWQPSNDVSKVNVLLELINVDVCMM